MRFSDLYPAVRGKKVPDTINRKDSGAEILSPGRGFIGGFDYTMQLQVGCPAACLYCYVPTGFRLTPHDVAKNWGFDVRTKSHAVRKLTRHLESGRLADKTIYWSGVTDPYTSSPAETIAIWKCLIRAPAELLPRRIVVQTRFAADRDAELIRQYLTHASPSDGGPAVVVSLSMGTDRDDVIRLWERTTPPFSSRMKTVQVLIENDVCVLPSLSPFGPWDDLPGALATFREFDIPFVTLLFFCGDYGRKLTPDPFKDHLREQFPELLDPAWQQMQLTLIQEHLGPERVLTGQQAFSALASPSNHGEWVPRRH